MTEDELKYQQELAERVTRYENAATGRRYLLWIASGIALFVIWSCISEPKCVWVPNYKKQEIVFIRKKLFHEDYVVRCTWQQNDLGVWGWCAKDPRGKWFIFACDEIWQAMNDYPNVLTGHEAYPHETNSKIND